MAKRRIFRPRTSSNDIRKKIKFYYVEKFFNKWMGKYTYPELNYQQNHFINKKFWCDGSISCSKVTAADKNLEQLVMMGAIDMKENLLIFTPWTFAERYNIYDFPTHIRLVNSRAVKFITTKILEIDKEAVIIYAQKNHKSVYSSIEAKIDEVVDLEMKKRVALKAQSQPWMFAFAPEDFDQAKVLQEQLENDEPYMFVPFNEIDKAKALNSGQAYIVDKLQNQLDGRVNEILTMLGVNNIGVSEKKEHLITSEVDANNEDIEQQSMSFTNEIEEGFDRVSNVFSFKVSVIDNNKQVKETEEAANEEEDGEDDSNNESN